MREENIVTHIHEAVEKHHLKVYYQPIVRTLTKEVTAFSCYIRYIDPLHGLPDDFIPILEEEHLCYLADLYVFEDVCQLLTTKAASLKKANDDRTD